MVVAARLGARSPRVRELRRLTRHAPDRRASRRFVIDGPVLLGEALDSGIGIELVVAAEGAVDPFDALLLRAEDHGATLAVIDERVLGSIADTTTPNSMVAVGRWSDVGLDELAGALPPGGLVLAVDGVADPGNLGTLLRTADAAGADGVLIGAGSADAFSPKVVRSAAGSLFHLPVVVGVDLAPALEQLASQGYAALATATDASLDYDEVDLVAPIVVVVGNEAHGVSPAVRAACRHRVRIPMAGGAESLNVATAAAVVCFEALRQRRRRAVEPASAAETIGRPGRARSS